MCFPGLREKAQRFDHHLHGGEIQSGDGRLQPERIVQINLTKDGSPLGEAIRGPARLSIAVRPGPVAQADPLETFMPAPPCEPLRWNADDQVPCDQAVILVDRRTAHLAGALGISRFGGPSAARLAGVFDLQLTPHPGSVIGIVALSGGTPEL